MSWINFRSIRSIWFVQDEPIYRLWIVMATTNNDINRIVVKMNRYTVEWKSFVMFLSLPVSPPQRVIRWCRNGRQTQAKDWPGSCSSGTSKPPALTVSIPQSDGETGFDVWGGKGGPNGAWAEGDRGGKQGVRGILYYLMKAVRWQSLRWIWSEEKLGPRICISSSLHGAASEQTRAVWTRI